MSALSFIEALEGRRFFSALPCLSVGDAVFTEGNAGTGYASVVVSLNGRSSKTVSVSYGTADGTADAGGDYNAVSGTLTFARGETSKSIQVPVRGDRTPEPDEYLFVDLRGVRNARVACARASLTLIDDEPRITVGSAGGVAEGDGGTTPHTFNVGLSLAYDQPVTVSYATRDDTAVAGEDYLATSGTLTFKPGETFRTVTVTVVGDVVADPSEGFYLDITSASANAHPTNGLSAYGTISDEEGVIEYDGSGDATYGYYFDDYAYWSYYYGY
jgi:chitinase